MGISHPKGVIVVKSKSTFLAVFMIALIALIVGSYCWINVGNVSFMGFFFTVIVLYVLFVIIYYWLWNKEYWNNLGRIRRTFYVLYILLIGIGFVFGKVDVKDWKSVTETTALAVFVDLAVFQNPNILKIWSAEFKHDNEILETLKQQANTILKSAKKVEKFSQVIQSTNSYFSQKTIPQNETEYRDELNDYIRTYSETFGFLISLFLFPVPTTEEEKKNHLKSQIQNIGMRHACEFSDDQTEEMMEKLSKGEIIPLRQEELISIPYYGSKYSILVTVEAKDVPVDAVDASHVSSLLYIFDWYMVEAEA